MTLSNEYSAKKQNKLPPKFNDLGSFIVPYTIGDYFDKALFDLGIAINFMPLCFQET